MKENYKDPLQFVQANAIRASRHQLKDRVERTIKYFKRGDYGKTQESIAKLKEIYSYDIIPELEEIQANQN